MGVCAASGRIGAMVAQFINGALVGRPVRLLIVASVTLAIGATTPFLLPQHGDMTGRPVQDDCDSVESKQRQSFSEDCSGQDDVDDDSMVATKAGTNGLSLRLATNSNGTSSHQRDSTAKKEPGILA